MEMVSIPEIGCMFSITLAPSTLFFTKGSRERPIILEDLMNGKISTSSTNCVALWIRNWVVNQVQAAGLLLL